MKQGRGVVLVAQKPSRGSGLSYPSRAGFDRVDVTSGSGKKIGKTNASSMSPLFLGPVDDCDGDSALRFENLWQYRKVFPQLRHWDYENHCPSAKWREWKTKGFSKLKGGKKGVRTPPEVSELKKIWRKANETQYMSEEEKQRALDAAKWTPCGLWWQGECLDYIASRKRVYVPIYAKLVAGTDAFKALKQKVDSGVNVMILDLDGPPLSLYPEGMEANYEQLCLMLNDPKYLFGHGYVVAALLADIDIEAMCTSSIKEQGEPTTKKQKNE